MKNKYDDAVFFEKYSAMPRSVEGLAGAGEWETLKTMLPEFNGKRVLDLGCGFGWHCQYAVQNGAQSVTGVDISENMLTVARKNTDSSIVYIKASIDAVALEPTAYDVVISSLALHYLPSFKAIAQRVYRALNIDGTFVFSVEHPTFTAYGPQMWHRATDGSIAHFPVDRYFEEGVREANFLGESVVKYHRTLTTYLQTLLEAGFEITGVVEPQPPAHLLDTVEGMRDELRRPMMLIVSARKNRR